MTWTTTELGEIAEFRNGLNYTKTNEGVGLRVINVKDFGERVVPNYSDLGELNPAGLLKDDALLKDGDIIFVRSNGNPQLVGRTLLIASPPVELSFSAFCIRARIKTKENPRFYSLYFRSPLFRRQLSAFGSGTNITNLNQQVLSRMPVPTPSPAIRRRVVEIIGAYDDLIANNQRRIELLEQSARLLFKEWFVHLRYPGHEHEKVVDGVPEGWHASNFTELAEFINGFAFKPHHWEDVGLPIIKIPELKEGVRQGTPRYSGVDVPERLKVCCGDLLFSWSGTLAIDFWAGEDGYLNQHLFLVKPYGRPSAAFLLLALREALPAFANLSVGATMKHIRRAALEQTRLLVPPSNLLSDFESVADDVYSMVINLRRQNVELARARDLLLPRLMDGRIGV